MICSKGAGIVGPRVISRQWGDMVKPGCLDHEGGHIAAKVSDLLPDVAEESITTPTAQEHHSVDWDMVQIHGHGCGRSARMKSDVLGVDAKTDVVNRGYVVPEGSQGNLGCDSFDGTIPTLVEVNEGIFICLKGLEPVDDGSRSLDWAEEGVPGGGLSNFIISIITFLPFKADGHFVSRFQVWRVVRDNPVVLPEDDVAFPDRFCAAFPRNLKVFTAAHSKEETKEVELVESQE